ncbi:hypothetical protein IAD21_04291 [Abditibacteriota bacterium]|nr:hypothetical protein IAD21_04291 [Abditibacteriota bacterium]
MAPLPESKPPCCPNCGAPLQQVPWWLIDLASIGVSFLGLVALVLGAFAIGFAAIEFDSGSNGLSNSMFIWFGAGAVLCAVAAIVVFRWLAQAMKSKP